MNWDWWDKGKVLSPNQVRPKDGLIGSEHIWCCCSGIHPTLLVTATLSSCLFQQWLKIASSLLWNRKGSLNLMSAFSRSHMSEQSRVQRGCYRVFAILTSRKVRFFKEILKWLRIKKPRDCRKAWKMHREKKKIRRWKGCLRRSFKAETAHILNFNT